jgi:signal transduction histidine kinase
MKQAGTLRHRMMRAFALFSLVVTVLFSGFALIFTYAVEDRFFNDLLDEEAAIQLEYQGRSGQWTQPRRSSMQVHADASTFPADLAARYRAAPSNNEYAGEDGRHYHLRRLHGVDTPPAFLVAEVSQQLVVRAMRYEILLWLAGIALMVLVGALLVGYALAARTARPLTALADKVQAMQPQRPPRDFPVNPSILEIDVLARGLESLASRVHAFIQREREFTRDASHELRTPLAVIQSACDRLAQDARLSAQARQQVDFMRQSVWQLEQTVGALLVLAREENSALAAESVPVLPMLEQVIVEQAERLRGKTVDVQLDVEPDAQMHLPRTLLHILLANLVGNAFAHTQSGYVRIRFADGRLHVDNSGSRNASLANDPHRPLGKGPASAGHGFGLAIATRLSERHAIDLRIDSDAHTTRASFAPRS